MIKTVTLSIFLFLNFFAIISFGQVEHSIKGAIPKVETVETKADGVTELSAIDLEIGQFMKQWGLPGASVALVKDGKLLYAKAFGKADINIPAQTDHVFRVASLSKPITAIAVMKLVEEGKLSLDDKVFGENGLLNDAPYNQIVDKRIKEITVRHLLQHTAGWDRNFGKEGDPMFNSLHIAETMGTSAPADAVTIIRYMLTKPLDFTPGTRFSYSNLGYNILGRVIEEVSLASYEEYVMENILNPLEIMDMSLGFSAYEDKQPKEVVYFERPELKLSSPSSGDGKVSYYPYGGFNLEAMDAHGGWLASATDLAKIIVASSGSGTGKDILTKGSTIEMAEPCDVYPYYGLGWCVNERGNRWHTGSLVGASSMMASLNNGIGWVLLFNGNPLTSEYFQSMDRVMWNALSNIKEWPSDDLFLSPENLKVKKDILVNNNPDLL